jgi:hypothetical protein
MHKIFAYLWLAENLSVKLTIDQVPAYFEEMFEEFKKQL